MIISNTTFGGIDVLPMVKQKTADIKSSTDKMQIIANHFIAFEGRMGSPVDEKVRKYVKIKI
jgi:hypothetical protein